MTVEKRPDYLPFGRPDFTDEEISAVTRVLSSGWVGMGPEVLAFEKELAEFVGAPHVVTVSSCTAALHLTLRDLGIGPDDEVICPSLTWCSSANSALYLGAKVVFCDVEERTLCASPESILEQVTPRTKAVVVVHFGGLAIDVKSLRRQLPPQIQIVEDAAHALGASYPDGTAVGSSGFPTCFSFYANKNLSTAEGGAVATSDDDLAASLRCLRQHGLSADAWMRYTDSRKMIYTPVEELGFKANYTDLQASIGRVQLRRFSELQSRRLEISRYYRSRLESITPQIAFQEGCDSDSHARHLFPILVPLKQLTISRDELLLQLRDRNIGATIHYTPLHQMPFYQETLGQQNLPVTDDLGERIMTLPISSSMTVQDAEYVCDHLIEVLTNAALPSS
jgi:perosamine synthetase